MGQLLILMSYCRKWSCMLKHSTVKHLSLVVRRSSGFPTRSDTNRAVQSQKMARGLKFWMWEVEGLYHPCSENKGADQLRGHREADLRLCFRICKKPVFSERGSFLDDYTKVHIISMQRGTRVKPIFWPPSEAKI